MARKRHTAEQVEVGKTTVFMQTAETVHGINGEDLTELDGQGSWLSTNVFADGQLIATYKNDNHGAHLHLTDWLGTRRMTVSSLVVQEEKCEH